MAAMGGPARDLRRWEVVAWTLAILVFGLAVAFVLAYGVGR